MYTAEASCDVPASKKKSPLVKISAEPSWDLKDSNTLLDSGCSRSHRFLLEYPDKSITFRSSCPARCECSRRDDKRGPSRHRSIGLCTSLIAGVNSAMFRSQTFFFPRWLRLPRARPWGDVWPSSSELCVCVCVCVCGLDEVQGRSQIQRPEPCVRCFFLLLQT